MDRKVFHLRQMRQRDPKGLGHFARIDLRRKRAGNKPDYGRDGKAGDRCMRGQAAHYLEILRIEPNLLWRFAQRGGVNMGIFCFDFTTGESNLVRVML